MKKFLSIFILILAIISFTGCQSPSSEENNSIDNPKDTVALRESYNVSLATDYFDTGFTSLPIQHSTDSMLDMLKDTTKKVVLPTGIEFEGTYSVTTYTNFLPYGYHTYEGKISTGERTTVRLDVKTGTVIYCQIDRQYTLSSEKKFNDYEQAYSVAADILAKSVSHPEKYELTGCYRSIKYNSILNYNDYLFNFTVVINGFKTYDSFSIQLSEFGDLVYYSNIAFGTMQNVEFPMDFNNSAMVENVRSYINSMYTTSYVEIADIKIASAELVTNEYNELILYVTCSWTEVSKYNAHDHPVTSYFVVPIT